MRWIRVTIGLIGVVSLASMGAILLFLPAPTAGVLGYLMVSVSLGLFLVSTLTFIGARARKAYITDGNELAVWSISLREAVLASVLVLAFMWLAHFKALNVWIVTLALLGMMGLEYFFLTHHKIQQ